MSTRPLLLFPTPGLSDRAKLGGGAQRVHYPPAGRQSDRLNPQIRLVEAAFETRRAELRTEVGGAEPEKVLVLETVGTITDFMNAVRRIEGMEWLAEVDEEEIAGDEDFFDSDNRAKRLSGRLFLVMTNQGALREMLRLWEAFQRQPDERFARGFGKWRSLFKQLRNIRVWGVEDRLRETGLLSVWEEEVAHNERDFRFEAELWFRGDEQRRAVAAAALRDYVMQQGGAVIAEAVFAEIAYHAIIGQVPVGIAQAVIANEDVRLLRCEEVMFFRPVGQAMVPPLGEGTADGGAEPRPEPSDQYPIAALLDGLPIENHATLVGRLIVDDPDGWSADYIANERQHGTAMASLILHGDLNVANGPSRHSLYVRPLMRPDPRDWREPRIESMPANVLPPDLLRRAVRRMFEGEAGSAAIAPTVRVINLSIGDAFHPYDRTVSAFARAVDWLSWEYRVLFVVSAGNQNQRLQLRIQRSEIAGMSVDQISEQCVTAVLETAHLRRLLAPAEAINAVTVGGIHEDGAVGGIPADRIDPFPPSGFPSAYNSLGSGFRRAIKPDVLLAGGRQLYSVAPGEPDSPAVLVPVMSTATAPGHRTAAPGAAPGELNRTRFTRGTSNATAVATRDAVTLADTVETLGIAPGLMAVTMKCLVAHGANWSEACDVLRRLLEAAAPEANVREQLARFVGNGNADILRVVGGTERRVTVIGTSEIVEGQGHTYRFPLPPSLSGVVGDRRITATLAWFSPINALHRNYRRAALCYTFPLGQTLRLDRVESDYRAAQRGTLQHEIFRGEQAVAYTDGTVIEIKVNCREDAGSLVESVPYCLAITLEVAPTLAVPVYDEVRARLQVPVPVRPT